MRNKLCDTWTTATSPSFTARSIKREKPKVSAENIYTTTKILVLNILYEGCGFCINRSDSNLQILGLAKYCHGYTYCTSINWLNGFQPWMNWSDIDPQSHIDVFWHNLKPVIGWQWYVFIFICEGVLLKTKICLYLHQMSVYTIFKDPSDLIWLWLDQSKTYSLI